MSLGIPALVLAVLWIIGFFFFHAGAWIHILLVVAIIMTMVRMSKRPVN